MMAAGRSAFERADRLRRSFGDALDALGFAPVATPSTIALELPGMRLRDYGGAAGAAAFVIVAAPIKRAYIWDLAPEASVVRRLRDGGLRPFLIEWCECREQARYGLADYADRLISAAVTAVARRTGRRRVVLAGHSLGGTLAALFAALHPARVGALVLLEAPTSFAAGAFAPLAAATPAGAFPALFDLVPGSVLDTASVAASPLSFLGARWLDRLAVAGDPHALLTHLRVERWACDEFPLSAALMGELVDKLYREDRFIRGTLTIGGRIASPAALDMPLLSVARPESLIIPPAALRPLHEAAPSRRKRWLRYDGEHGAALRHMGVLVGRRAHRALWPEILRWANASAAARCRRSTLSSDKENRNDG